jgi:hypothetical protein
MTQRGQKQHEEHLLKRELNRIGLQYEIVRSGERPDFVLACNGLSIGVEISEFHFAAPKGEDQICAKSKKHGYGLTTRSPRPVRAGLNSTVWTCRSGVPVSRSRRHKHIKNSPKRWSNV